MTCYCLTRLRLAFIFHQWTWVNTWNTPCVDTAAASWLGRSCLSSSPSSCSSSKPGTLVWVWRWKGAEQQQQHLESSGGALWQTECFQGLFCFTEQRYTFFLQVSFLHLHAFSTWLCSFSPGVLVLQWESLQLILSYCLARLTAKHHLPSLLSPKPWKKK